MDDGRGRRGDFRLREAKAWEGHGTSLAPSHEPIVVARKPLVGTVAENCLRHGTGAINVDGCRIGTTVETWPASRQYASGNRMLGLGGKQYEAQTVDTGAAPPGRWPKNTVLVHDARCRQTGTKKVRAPVINRFDDGAKPFGGGAGHPYTSEQRGDPDGTETVAAWECVPECMVGRLDEQAGNLGKSGDPRRTDGTLNSGGMFGTGVQQREDVGYGDSGSCSRFFPQFQAERARYVAKAGRRERNAGLGEFEEQQDREYRTGNVNDTRKDGGRSPDRLTRNPHPTVKPVGFMRWLVRLVTRPGGLVLDCFAGSGSTGIATILEGMNFIGIEKQGPEYVKANPDADDYVSIMRARIAHAETHPWDYDPDVPEPKKGDEAIPGQMELL